MTLAAPLCPVQYVSMFRFFEHRVAAYPDSIPGTPPKGFFAFIWRATAGIRPLLLGLTRLTALIGAFEALVIGSRVSTSVK